MFVTRGKDNATSKNQNEEANTEIILPLMEGGMEGEEEGGKERVGGSQKMCKIPRPQ